MVILGAAEERVVARFSVMEGPKALPLTLSCLTVTLNSQARSYVSLGWVIIRYILKMPSTVVQHHPGPNHSYNLPTPNLFTSPLEVTNTFAMSESRNQTSSARTW